MLEMAAPHRPGSRSESIIARLRNGCTISTIAADDPELLRQIVTAITSKLGLPPDMLKLSEHTLKERGLEENKHLKKGP